MSQPVFDDLATVDMEQHALVASTHDEPSSLFGAMRCFLLLVCCLLVVASTTIFVVTELEVLCMHKIITNSSLHLPV